MCRNPAGNRRFLPKWRRRARHPTGMASCYRFPPRPASAHSRVSHYGRWLSRRAPRAASFRSLMPGRAFIDLQQLDGLDLRLEAVEPTTVRSPAFHFALIAVLASAISVCGKPRSMAAIIPPILVDLPDVTVGRPLGFERQLFQEVAAAQRIGCSGHARFRMPAPVGCAARS